MLPLTPMPLQTAGERALFAELARWDTGGAVRAAVVASIPVVTDGPLQRRLADAVLIVPEGIAVVRVVDVERQSGVVTAAPDGPWTIAPGPGPGDVLQLGGGGSTPLDGLMRAGMDAAMRLRHAGLEPGRIARLTVLVGNITGLQPADGDLGEGDQVALMDPRSLLLGIARASRYAGLDNPRLWTTADVRAALEALGLHGRGPSVEELNGEGFPYSPYVLRRPELLTPAAMNAAPPTAGPVAPPATGPTTVPPSPSPSPPAPVPAAPAPVAPVAGPLTTQPVSTPPAGSPWTPAAATLTATQAATAPPQAAPSGGAGGSFDPFAGRPARDTVAVGSPSGPEDTDGIGGLFASADPVPPPAVPPHTSVLATPQWQPAAPPWQPAPPAAAPRRSGSSKRALLVVLAAVVALAVVAGGGWYLLSRMHRTSGPPAASPTTSSQAAVTLQPGRVQQAGGIPFTLEAVRVDNSCKDHAYDAVAGFFAANDCTGLSRALYSADVDGHPMVLAIDKVRMPDAAGATALLKLADTSGTGNVSDLLREGVRYPGGPARLVASEYASIAHGNVATIVETSWVSPASAGTSTQLDTTATTGLDLDVEPFPGS